MEMSWAVPGSRPVSDMNWIMVIGPNQHAVPRPVGVVGIAHVLDSTRPPGELGDCREAADGDRAPGEVRPDAARGSSAELVGCRTGLRQTPRVQSMYDFQKRWLVSVIWLFAFVQV